MADIIDFDSNKTKSKQLHLDLGVPLEPPKDVPETTEETKVPVVQPTVDSCIMPTTLQSAAQSSISLRSVQQKLIDTVTNGPYLDLIAATKPEAIPSLIDSVNNSVAVSDNLMIQMARVAEKNASMNRVFEYLTKKQENKAAKEQSELTKDDEYKESIDKIKTAIYGRLTKERNAHPKSAKDFIEVEYETIEETTNEDIQENIKEDTNEINEEPTIEVVDIDAEEFPLE